jgi:pimeloyl-ACP methyl ester carboxylesterase
MHFALQHPEQVNRLVVVDIAPVVYGVRSCEVEDHTRYIDAMLSVDLRTVASRREVEVQLRAHVPDPTTRLFLLTNLQSTRSRNGGPKFRWRSHLRAIRHCYRRLAGFPMLDDPLCALTHALGDPHTHPSTGTGTVAHIGPNAPPPPGESGPVCNQYDVEESEQVVSSSVRVHFVGGADSHYFVPEQRWVAATLMFPNSTTTIIPGCGHWPHFSHQKEFVHCATDFLVELE